MASQRAGIRKTVDASKSAAGPARVPGQDGKLTQNESITSVESLEKAGKRTLLP